jgi:protein AFG1
MFGIARSQRLVRTSFSLVKRWNSSLIAARYDSLVQSGGLSFDETQLKSVKLLDKLREKIELFDFAAVQKSSATSSPDNTIAPSRLRGMFLFGSVGTGKTMLMDMMLQECRIERKRRVHFHQFMLEVHRRIHQHKQFLLHKYGRQRNINLSEDQDSIRFVAKEISREANLLCFDEFQVTDICDAVIITRLFDTLWSQGAVLIATSNRPPEDLYLNGMNRRDFLPFIERLKKECIVRELDSGKDYRLLRHHKESGKHQINNFQKNLFLFPLTKNNRDIFNASYYHDVDRLKSESISIRTTASRTLSTGQLSIPIPNSNRQLIVEQAEPAYGIALVDFSELCESERGASDYYVLATTFHTVYLANIPRLSKEKHNAARRFITLIDELYNANVRLVCLAETALSDIFLDTSAHANDKDNMITHSPETLDGLKYGRNYSPARFSIPVGTELASKAKKKEEYGAMGQQEEISVVESELSSIQELGFAFKRATSRLYEMSSPHYFTVWQSRYLT